MVSEEEHLRLLGQFAQHLEAGTRSVVVEIDKQIVSHEREGICTTEIIFYGSNA